jgi:DnaJ-class molecular chaperone
MNNEESAGQKDIECKKIIEKTDYYDILGLNKDATEDEIRKNYKKMAIKFHPDKNSSKFAEDAFKKVSHSFSVLSNKEKKQNYDKFGSEEGMGMPNGGGGFSRDDIDPFVFIF